MPVVPKHINPSTHSSSKHFEGEVTDGDTIVRIVGFDKVKQAELKHFWEAGKPITLQNCQIQLSQLTNKLEVMVKEYTKVVPSDTTFPQKDVTTIDSEDITLDQLPSKSDNQRVNVSATVIKVSDTTPAGKKMKQDLLIGDQTSTATLTLFNDNINMLQNCQASCKEF